VVFLVRAQAPIGITKFTDLLHLSAEVYCGGGQYAVHRPDAVLVDLRSGHEREPTA
jgi:hypothetical protein